MSSTYKWGARAAVLALSATALAGMTVGSASAQGSTCTPGGQRPNGPVTNLLTPLLGQPGFPNLLGDAPFAITGALDAVVCQLLP